MQCTDASWQVMECAYTCDSPVAVALTGTTVSGFILQNAYEAARRVVSDFDTLMLTQRDFEAFASSMKNAPKPKAALRKLMAR